MTDQRPRPRPRCQVAIGPLSRRRFATPAATPAVSLGACGAPPPRAAPAAAEPDRHALFFEPDSAALDVPGRDLIVRLAAEIRAQPAREIVVTAFANRAPDGSENRVLADQRAETITRALEAQGLDSRLVRRIVVGQADRIGLSALEGRRVEIDIRR